MSKLDKLFIYALLGGLVLTLILFFMPTSINDFYTNPEIYDTGFNYYLWKFRAIDQDVVARVTAWVFFILHFGAVGYLSKKLKSDQPNKVDGYSKYNVYLLLTNAFFVLLHFVHTWVWYDALAQDTPVWSSQGSVIIMLVLVLIIENRRRGLFFGKKVPFPKESTRAVMKYHGVYISLATIFTFWYHPMEVTPWHIVGFFYMYLLFIQMSFARTKLHQNKYFNITLEVMVLIHGTSVAFYSGNAPWAMFLFGFAAIFFVTQIYGLGLSKRSIHISQAIFVLIALLTYSGLVNDRMFYEINEVIRIPFIEYILVFVIVYGIYGWMKLPVHRIVKRVIGIVFIVIASLYAILTIYTMSSYQPEALMYEKIDEIIYFYENPEIDAEEGFNYYAYKHEDTNDNIIIVPGGKVNPEAYRYLAIQLYFDGYDVTVVKPPFNLAILQPNLAEKFLVEGENNYVIGHSLGGVVASLVTSNNDVDILFLLGSYPIADVSDTFVQYIVGSEEKLLENANYHISMNEQVDEYFETVIDGGNHAYFGFYGEQKGDGTATLTNLEQQELVADLIQVVIEGRK